jgi:hypothetical protein
MFLYNVGRMAISASAMRVLLLLGLLGMALLAVLFLRGRRLSLSAHFGWGLFVILLPALGPFLVLLIKPGKPKGNRVYYS